MAIPTEPGFYWAKHTKVDPGTQDEDGYCFVDQWETVEVFENHIKPGEPDYLRVFVLGVSKSQSLENFIWGPAIPEYKGG